MDTQILLPIISAVSALFGAAIGSFASIGVAWVNKRSEERKHLREIVIKTAVENYKEERALLRLFAEREPHRTIRMYPLDDYILGMSQLVDVLEKKLSPEELGQELEKLEEYRRVVHQHWDSQVEASRAKSV